MPDHAYAAHVEDEQVIPEVVLRPHHITHTADNHLFNMDQWQWHACMLPLSFHNGRGVKAGDIGGSGGKVIKTNPRTKYGRRYLSTEGLRVPIEVGGKYHKLCKTALCPLVSVVGYVGSGGYYGICGE